MSTLPSIGTLIWISCRPIIKMAICTGAGFILSKIDLFNNVAARGAGQVLLNITVPCLMFSKIVPSFTPQNIPALGALVAIGLIYHGVGLMVGLVVRGLFWVPHRFRSGVIAAGIWGNHGDIPTAVIMSITASAPFGPNDTNLGIAYISAFILVSFVTLFPLGGHRLILKDFEGPNKEDQEVRDDLRASHRKLLSYLRRCVLMKQLPSRVDEEMTDHEVDDAHLRRSSRQQNISRTMITTTVAEVVDDDTHVEHRRGVSFDLSSHPHHLHRAPTIPVENAQPSTSVIPTLDAMSPSPTTVTPTEKDFNNETKEEVDREKCIMEEQLSSPARRFTILQVVANFARSLVTPVTISILAAFPISLIPQLKGLFVTFDNSPIPIAPDGHPPLYFLYDTADFLGAASVPLGLVCLGSALASLKVPKNLQALPIGAISGMAIGKLIISPLIGILLVNSFVNIGFIREDDKVLRFVCIFSSCMPTATAQVLLTQVYSGTGEAEHLSAFLIPQYALMFITSTAVMVYALHLLF